MRSLISRGHRFDDFFKDFAPGLFVRPLRENWVWDGQDMPIDVRETDQAYMVKADMPGLKKEDIKVAIDGNTVLGGVQAEPLVVLRALQERLGRDAPDVHAGAAQSLVGFNAGDGEAELGRADGGDVSAGSSTEDHDISSVQGWGSHAAKLTSRPKSLVGITGKTNFAQPCARWHIAAVGRGPNLRIENTR